MTKVPRRDPFAADEPDDLRSAGLSEDDNEDSNREWSRFWLTARNFWCGWPAWRVWLLCAILVGIVMLQLYVQFRFNTWNRDFFNALEGRDPARLREQAMLLAPLCLASVALAVASVWGRMAMQRNWRQWLAAKVIDYWIENDRYARLALVQGDQKIPEYRIAEDVRIATDAPVDFAVNVISSLLTAIIFLQVLWQVGGPIGFSFAGYHVWIPGYLVVSVAVYSGLVTGAMLWVGSPLTRVIQVKNQAESELITAAHLLRDIGEGVSPKDDTRGVIAALWQALDRTIRQWRRLCWRLMRMTLVSHTNSLLAPIIGLVLCAPKFLSNEMSLGELTQAAAAFTLVQGSFNWLVDNYSRVADWMSSLERVGGLLLSLDLLNDVAEVDVRRSEAARQAADG
ncbi:putative ABC transporter-like [Bradyrhizobium sp. ORS 285]|uniref:SbmA/BacA-like family transporter n=1 Tax=Bradyrhizobium sp. ORS 285 TaxID=115808 RepID=UPI00024062AA|nr:SbmA/BacA-like family transporter [Bradyrhizobium sp. ORS 285]AKO22172.1 putative ABC transporter-like protein [Bradyrhizobium sp. ORS 285]CCD90124.1 putative ABC transporter-like [Bradyrhizobium sp. ORS 285]SMX60611.1 putative ABC transporter-like [Bradyrhizobium sp. ORS 285]